MRLPRRTIILGIIYLFNPTKTHLLFLIHIHHFFLCLRVMADIMNETGETGEPKAKVLLAEDDRMTRLIASSSLVKHGYQVVEVDNGGAAYDKAISEQPDIILLDVQMPVMDGFEVLKKLRADPSTVATPVILLTGMPADQGEIAAWEMGACHYILDFPDRTEFPEHEALWDGANYKTAY